MLIVLLPKGVVYLELREERLKMYTVCYMPNRSGEAVSGLA
jgi:hypothetical protein